MSGEGNEHWLFEHDLEVMSDEFGILSIGHKANMEMGDKKMKKLHISGPF